MTEYIAIEDDNVIFHFLQVKFGKLDKSVIAKQCMVWLLNLFHLMPCDHFLSGNLNNRVLATSPCDGVTFKGGRTRCSRKKPAGIGYPNQGWARKARTAKRVSTSRKTGKWYSNCYDKSLALRLYVERVGKLRQHVH